MQAGNDLTFGDRKAVNINMNRYDEFVEQAVEVVKRNPNSQFGIMYVDISGFQSVNNFYGFSEGDRLLEEFAKFLVQSPRAQICGRVFSDHFLRLAKFEDGLDITQASREYVDKLEKFLAKQREFHPDCKLYINCGLCMIDSADKLVVAVDNANIARKESKTHNKTSIVWFNDEMKERVYRRKELEQKIQKALRDEEFTFFLQPKVNLDTGKIVGCEALARWFSEGKSLIYPDEFIPIMEKNGTIIELDFFICEKVCEIIEKRIKENKPVVAVSINLSRLHTINIDTAKRLHEIASSHNIAPELLEFEITETLLLDSFDNAKRIMDELRDFGYSVSIDDFGSGYAGINIWQSLDFDVLKLDKSFLSEIEGVKVRNNALIPNIIEIARKLQTSVLCEGTETVQQCDYMRKMGCNIAQGYFFSPPIMQNEFFDLLEKGNGYFSVDALSEVDNCDNKKGINVISDSQVTSIADSVLSILQSGMLGADEKTGKLLFVTQGLIDMLGIDVIDNLFVENQKWESLLFNHTLEKSSVFNEKARFDDEGHLDGEYVLQNSNGQQVYTHLFAGRANSPEWGQYVLCCFVDETQRKLAEISVKAQDKFFEKIVDSLSSGLMEFDFEELQNGRMYCIEANTAAMNILGYDNENFWTDCAPNVIFSMVHPDYIKYYKERISKLSKLGDSLEFEHKSVRLDKNIIWIRGRLEVIANKNGKLCVLSVFSDCTEQKQEKEKIDDYHKWLNNIAGIMSIETWEYVTATSTIYMPNLYELFSSDEFGKIKMTVETLFTTNSIAKEDKAQFLSLLRDNYKPEEKKSCEVRFLTKDGSYKWYRLITRAINNESGWMYKVVGVMEDIHEEKERDIYKKRLQEEAKNLEISNVKILEDEKLHEKTEKKSKKMQFNKNTLFIASGLFIVCFISVFLLFINFSKMINNEFIQMEVDKINAYTNGQCEDIISYVDEMCNALNSISMVIGNSSVNEVEKYLNELNQLESNPHFTYKSKDEINELIETNEFSPKDAEIGKLIKQSKEPIISDIEFSTQYGSEYYFGVGMPVFENQEFIGAVRGIANADSLLATNYFPTNQSVILDSYIVNSSGDVIISKNGKNNFNLIDTLVDAKDLSIQNVDSLLQKIKSGEKGALTHYIENDEGRSYFISCANLKYNDWNYVAIVDGSQALFNSKQVIRNSVVFSSFIIIIACIVCIIVLVIVLRRHRRNNLEEKRYIMLQEFSDTVLFEYSFAMDTINFTHNARKLLQVRSLEIPNFSSYVSKTMIHEDDREKLVKLIENAKGKRDDVIEIRPKRPDGSYFWCFCQVRYVYEKSQLVSIIGKLVDVSYQKEREENLIVKSATDSMTGLMNKDIAKENIEKLMEKGESGYMFMIDLDDFKNVNDTLGHQTGDDMLIMTSDILKSVFRESDIVSRIGGDEFLAYVTNLSNIEIINSMIAKIHERIADQAGESGHKMTVSIGMAAFPKNGNTFEELFDVADQAMYQSKRLKHKRKK